MVIGFLTESYSTLRRSTRRQLLQRTINLALVVCSTLMLWKSLVWVTGSETPVLVVLSGSMGPGFQRGDLLFVGLWEKHRPLSVGDMVVFRVDGRDIPIVHRVLRAHHVKADGQDDVYLLTKGDHNSLDDRALYAAGQEWPERKHVTGRVEAYAHCRTYYRYLPYVGMAAIILYDYPMAKYLLLGFLGLRVLTK
eukprot:TRINITY_DN34308_c0_g1_i1.p2 TRINITY_DN34308_c0_g1~~TRINITY_DN34308_c0_g1_i1.p2  ORF type:complete len:203 (-),score=31.32 TRINITY_DN34308_c0_g1_i1:50-631(-)